MTPRQGWAGGTWTPKTEYASDVDDLAVDFYEPAMSGAMRYDRITGYFSSGAFILYWRGLRAFAARGGRLRLLCSPAITDPDGGSIRLGYQARDDSELALELSREFTALLDAPELRNPALVLAALISEGILDVRLATVHPNASSSSRAMFHDKVGVFADAAGEALGFRGSANETFLGLSRGGNVESIDAWPSWLGGRHADRVAHARRRFDQLWLGKSAGVEVHHLPAGLTRLLRKEASRVDWQELAQEQEALQRRASSRSSDGGRKLRKQQTRGLAAWRDNGFRGILAHATGSGKTVTGIRAITEHDGPVLVVAPTELVAGQWEEQLKVELKGSGRRVHLAGAGQTDWTVRLVDWLTQPGSGRVVVAVAPTASSELFINQARRASGLLLVGDEVHRYGAASYGKVLTIDAEKRLGLSATPERAGDPEGTGRLLDYFDGIVDRYDLNDAIADDVLCRYLYYPTVVELDQDELDQWRDLGRRIGRAMAAFGSSSTENPAVRALVMRRARIAKKAAAKAPAAVRIVAENFQSGQRWLVYCEDIEQMESVQEGLTQVGVPAKIYHSAMAGDKAATLSHFASNGGVIVSIRCLDEGVDIPEASHAVILASSQNPREFIQRRGRVLRKSPLKELAHIYDVVVVPSGEADDTTRSLIWSELARAAEFGSHALNSDPRIPLEEACMRLGIDLNDLYEVLGGGIEDE